MGIQELECANGAIPCEPEDPEVVTCQSNEIQLLRCVPDDPDDAGKQSNHSNNNNDSNN